MSNSPLQGKTMLITGASSGIGRACAVELDQAGMNLVLTARRAERLETLAAGLQNAVCVPGDIVDPALPALLVETAQNTFGSLDATLNNAAVMNVGEIDTVDIESLCSMVRVNVEAAYRVAYTVLRAMRRAGRGHLINISSVLGTKTRERVGAYAGTKFAIEALSESLRMECAKTAVKVTCFEPGLVLTGLHDHWPQHPVQTFGIQKPLQPEDIARGIRFILEQPDHVRIPVMMMMPGEQVS